MKTSQPWSPYKQASANYFSNSGERVTVYVTDVNFSTDISKIGKFVSELENRTSIVSSVNTFYPEFYDYVGQYYGREINSTGKNFNLQGTITVQVPLFFCHVGGLKFPQPNFLDWNFSVVSFLM